MWYSFDNIEKKDRLFNWIVSARGPGKTIALKKRIVKRGLDGNLGLYVRRQKAECEADAMGDFFLKMQSLGYYKELNLSYEKGRFLCDKRTLGYVTPLSTSVNIRSQDFYGVTDIYFEEFVLREDKNHKYLKDEVELFLELYNTVSRNTDPRVWFIGNNVDSFNPYFLYFDIIPPDDGIKVWKDHAIEFYRSEEYEKKVLNTRFGRLIADTNYGNYSIKNQSLNTQLQFICRVPKGVRPLFNIIYYGKLYGVYAGHNNFTYIGNNKNDSKIIVSFETCDYNSNNINYKGFRGTFECGYYIQSLKHNKIYYSSEKIEQIGRIVNKKLYFI